MDNIDQLGIQVKREKEAVKRGTRLTRLGLAVRQGPHEEGTCERRLNMAMSRMEVGNWVKDLLVAKGDFGKESAWCGG